MVLPALPAFQRGSTVLSVARHTGNKSLEKLLDRALQASRAEIARAYKLAADGEVQAGEGRGACFAQSTPPSVLPRH